VNGEGVIADVASRSKSELLERQYAALGIRAQRQQVRDDSGRVGEDVIEQLSTAARIEQGRACDPAAPAAGRMGF